MKKVSLLLTAAIIAVMMSSCSALGSGLVYEDITVPHSVTSNTIGDNTKVGRSSYISVVGVAIGDAGINVAAKNAGIKKISHVDKQQFSILGVYTKSETIVYGE